jgi:type IV pilus assembly protein PilA
MIVVAIVGILVSIATVNYQNQVRKTQIMLIYQSLNDFRTPYQILLNDGEGVTDFSPSGLNMPLKTQYCQFRVTAPVKGANTPDAIMCSIQNLPYLKGESLHLDLMDDGKWQCRASSDISEAYLPQACQ